MQPNATHQCGMLQITEMPMVSYLCKAVVFPWSVLADSVHGNSHRCNRSLIAPHLQRLHVTSLWFHFSSLPLAVASMMIGGPCMSLPLAPTITPCVCNVEIVFHTIIHENEYLCMSTDLYICALVHMTGWKAVPTDARIVQPHELYPQNQCTKADTRA